MSAPRPTGFSVLLMNPARITSIQRITSSQFHFRRKLRSHSDEKAQRFFQIGSTESTCLASILKKSKWRGRDENLYRRGDRRSGPASRGTVHQARAQSCRSRRDFAWTPQYPTYREGLDQIFAAWKSKDSS